MSTKREKKQTSKNKKIKTNNYVSSFPCTRILVSCFFFCLFPPRLMQRLRPELRRSSTAQFVQLYVRLLALVDQACEAPAVSESITPFQICNWFLRLPHDLHSFFFSLLPCYFFFLSITGLRVCWSGCKRRCLDSMLWPLWPARTQCRWSAGISRPMPSRIWPTLLRRCGSMRPD